jgi:hypothetical protein
MTTQECEVCGASFRFHAYPSWIKQGRGRFCSRSCSAAYRKGWVPASKPRKPSTTPKQRISLTCLYCGCVFEAFPYEAGRSKYCSKACKQEGGKNKRRVSCTYCGNLVDAHPSKIQRNKAGVFCSLNCANDWVSKNRRGDAHPGWKGGNYNQPYPIEYRRIRPSILARDGHKCRICGSSHRPIVHHIDENIHNNERGNLVTVCPACHRGPIHGSKTIVFAPDGSWCKARPEKPGSEEWDDIDNAPSVQRRRGAVVEESLL